MKFTKRFRKLRKEYFRVAVAACVFTIFAVPFVSKFAFNDEVSDFASLVTPGRPCYTVVLNGSSLGVVEDADAAMTALYSVRKRLNSENSATVYADADIEIYNHNNYKGKTISAEELETAMYDSISKVAYVPENLAYTVRINDFMVTLGSEDEVVELLERVKNRVANTEQFTVELVDSSDKGITRTGINLASADIQVNEAAKVLATVDGSNFVQVTENTVFEDGVLFVGFVENIEIITTTKNNSDVLSVDDAFDLVTKETAAKEIYEVVSGDTLWGISEKTGVSLNELYALNDGLTESTTLYPGDTFIITVPKPELSVVVKEETTYEEEYNAPVEYVDNARMYRGQENVISYGTPGYREVIAIVSYLNGAEYDREIISQTIIKESTPTVIERGTATPPTFIKPVNSTYITSNYGYRTHPITGAWALHSGVDWYVPSGTAVKASCGGTVTQSGWNGGYGYCVTIDHGNGLSTRYGHLNSTAVYVGQSVSQGQVIGYSGSTGNSTGPHLHFEVMLWGNFKNPFEYVTN